ncbi:MAG: T9SS type A sorting domain-containing protein [Bacteroidales bacterium]|nr:T9SS type A sorting domain-containing protein [Bacteroidales bacterium]
MKKKKSMFCLLLLSCFCYAAIHAQQTIPATGGNATGSGGSVSYTVGQITYQTISGTNGTVAQGVQQPYEISIVTAIENTEGITLEYRVYPNPTRGLITLIIKPYDNENLKYRLYNLNGILLQDKKVESEETVISMENLSSAIYFLKVLKDNNEIKIFKIVKR